MAIIKKMDQQLSNMIAAGEVVDRPASVVKELVENAIDAQANLIKIEIKNAGLTSIVVTDNGIGMDEDDAKAAFSRYATSKLTTKEDLEHIKTLGFRGEALAAIASVSKVILKTKQADGTGFFVVYEQGKLVDQGSVALNQGTQIEVNNLFFNTPARFKYLLSEQAEKQAVIDLFDRLALSNPKIRFQLIIDEKMHKETYGMGDIANLVDQIFGANVSSKMAHFREVFQKATIEGYLIRPEINRSRRKDIYFYVNKRSIKNYRLIQAVVEGYHGLLMTNRYPIAIIYLTMDPVLLDVNIHPQKTEIKLANETLLAYQIENYIKAAFKDQTQAYFEPKLASRENIVVESLNLQEEVIYENEHNDQISNSEERRSKLPYLNYIGLLHGTYLLFQNEKGLYLVDQHAAAERIRYEHYHRALGNPVFAKKQMLFSKRLELTKEDLLVIRQYEQEFDKYGFQFNEDQELISHPTWLKEAEMDLAVESMLTMLQETQAVDLNKLRDELAKDISCKGAIKANKHLNDFEVRKLMSDLDNCENPYTCPHGRPTIILLSETEIEKLFKRIV
ncbi:MAG: DNA mismatch repair endonuclease MutL [Acholeplasmataceae bacterium]